MWKCLNGTNLEKIHSDIQCSENVSIPLKHFDFVQPSNAMYSLRFKVIDQQKLIYDREVEDTDIDNVMIVFRRLEPMLCTTFPSRVYG